MQTIDLIKLKELVQSYPEIKRICLNKAVPVYLLQLELERYKLKLNPCFYTDFQKIRAHLK